MIKKGKIFNINAITEAQLFPLKSGGELRIILDGISGEIGKRLIDIKRNSTDNITKPKNIDITNKKEPPANCGKIYDKWEVQDYFYTHQTYDWQRTKRKYMEDWKMQ